MKAMNVEAINQIPKMGSFPIGAKPKGVRAVLKNIPK
jgi:hypothetical protein